MSEKTSKIARNRAKTEGLIHIMGAEWLCIIAFTFAMATTIIWIYYLNIIDKKRADLKQAQSEERYELLLRDYIQLQHHSQREPGNRRRTDADINHPDSELGYLINEIRELRHDLCQENSASIDMENLLYEVKKEICQTIKACLPEDHAQ